MNIQNPRRWLRRTRKIWQMIIIEANSAYHYPINHHDARAHNSVRKQNRCTYSISIGSLLVYLPLRQVSVHYIRPNGTYAIRLCCVQSMNVRSICRCAAIVCICMLFEHSNFGQWKCLSTAHHRIQMRCSFCLHCCTVAGICGSVCSDERNRCRCCHYHIYRLHPVTQYAWSDGFAWVCCDNWADNCTDHLNISDILVLCAQKHAFWIGVVFVIQFMMSYCDIR